MTTDLDPQVVRDVLALARWTWRDSRSDIERSSMLRQALHLFRLLDHIIPPAERWSSLPTESQLDGSSTLGDHLSVTRTLLGLCA